MKRGILYKKREDEGDAREQLVVPQCYREEILKGFHNDIGHPGKERTMTLRRNRYYWPGMGENEYRWVNICQRCIRRKTSTHSRAPFVYISPHHTHWKCVHGLRYDNPVYKQNFPWPYIQEIN